MSKLTQTNEGYLSHITSSELQAVIQENHSEGLDVGQLDRIKFPTSGATTFIIPDVEGERNEKTVTGVILHDRTTRALFEKSFEEDPNQKPVCSSADGITGVINDRMDPAAIDRLAEKGLAPTGRCHNCPAAQWGTGKNNSQACRKRRPLAILMQGDTLPTILSLPGTSIRPWEQYTQGLTKKGLSKLSVSTTIGLTQVKNAGNITYSQATFTVAERITPDEIAKIRAIRDVVLNSNLESQMAEEPFSDQFRDE